jgi:uncharacterized LabA/DUF88 family protein
MQEPRDKRAVAFFDGQNLFRHAKDAFGHYHPNYDPQKLFDKICTRNSWKNHGVRFYTGTPDSKKAPEWHGYWTNRLLALRRSGVIVESRPIRYRKKEISLPDGSTFSFETSQEKGIDIRIALDVIRLTFGNQLDVAVIFSQDQDLSEVAKEVVEIAKLQKRWIKIASAFPSGPKATSSRGINNTDWIKIDQALYDSCLDLRDYRPKKR